jgi:hypothetical protein
MCSTRCSRCGRKLLRELAEVLTIDRGQRPDALVPIGLALGGQVNLFDSGGMPKSGGVVEPTRVDELADTFRSLNVDYEIELYDVQGSSSERFCPEHGN